MSSEQLAPADEMTLAETLPQADASALIDRDVLEAQVKDVYRHVAWEEEKKEEAELHFAVGRELAPRLGYPGELLDAIPPEALASFAGSATASSSPRSRPVNAKYPHGVGRLRTRDHTTSGDPVTTFKREHAPLPDRDELQPRLDRDDDGIACERSTNTFHD